MIEKNSSLQELILRNMNTYIGDNQIMNDGAKFIGEGLKINTTLLLLDLCKF